MKCPDCGNEVIKDRCVCGWEDKKQTKDIKCECGHYARTEHFGKWVCWDCRARLLRESPCEDWRDKLLREYCRENEIHKMTREQQIEFLKNRVGRIGNVQN